MVFESEATRGTRLARTYRAAILRQLLFNGAECQTKSGREKNRFF